MKFNQVSFEKFVEFLQGKKVIGDALVNNPNCHPSFVREDYGLTASLDDGSIVGIESKWKCGYYSDIDGEDPEFFIADYKKESNV